jgi:hypothetical protein
MQRITIAIAFALVAFAGGGAAPQPKCLKAEINPVTGQVLCIDPLGAPVEPLPPEAALACKPEQSRGQWTWAPNCTPPLPGM